jgi:hypothetical protein
VIESWLNLYNDELRNLYSSPSIIRMVKSRRMRWAGNVERRGRGEGECIQVTAGEVRKENKTKKTKIQVDG